MKVSMPTLNSVPVPFFVANPTLSQVNTAMTGTITFKKGTGASVNITGWQQIAITPTADTTVYFNTDTTKTFIIKANAQTVITIHPLTTQIVCAFGAATASVQAN
jgi:hypothetical protein